MPLKPPDLTPYMHTVKYFPLQYLYNHGEAISIGYPHVTFARCWELNGVSTWLVDPVQYDVYNQMKAELPGQLPPQD